MNNIKFARVRPGAIIPTKRREDMGYDIYPCFDETAIFLKPHETKLIPTGIASACDAGYGFILRERGSTGSKGIALRSGVIDSGYRNEWFVCITNTTNKVLAITKLSNEATIYTYNKDIRFGEDYFIFYPYSKAIAQALLIEVPDVEAEEISYKELQDIPSERGLGALGSSGK